MDRGNPSPFPMNSSWGPVAAGRGFRQDGAHGEAEQNLQQTFLPSFPPPPSLPILGACEPLRYLIRPPLLLQLQLQAI
jgi:hypothetical protein